MDQLLKKNHEEILHRLKSLEKEVNKLPSQQDLDDAVDGILTGVNKLGDDLLAAIAALQAKIASGVDPTADLVKLKAAAQKVADADQDALAQIPPTP